MNYTVNGDLNNLDNSIIANTNQNKVSHSNSAFAGHKFMNDELDDEMKYEMNENVMKDIENGPLNTYSGESNDIQMRQLEYKDTPMRYINASNNLMKDLNSSNTNLTEQNETTESNFMSNGMSFDDDNPKNITESTTKPIYQENYGINFNDKNAAVSFRSNILQKQPAICFEISPFTGNNTKKTLPTYGQFRQLESIQIHLQSVILNFLSHFNYTHIEQHAFEMLQCLVPTFIETIAIETHSHLSLSRRTDANVLDILYVLETMGYDCPSLLDATRNLTSIDDIYMEEQQLQNALNAKSYFFDDTLINNNADGLSYLPPLPEPHTYRHSEHIPPPKKFTEVTLRKEAQEIEASLTDIYMAQTSMKSLHFEDQYDRESKLVSSSELRSRAYSGAISSRPIVNPYMPLHLKSQVRIHIADVASQHIDTSEDIQLIPPLVRLREHVEHMSRWKLPKNWNEIQRKCDPSMRTVQHILRFQNPQMR